MAVELQGVDIGWMTASADLSAKQFHFVYASGNETVTFTASAGTDVLGILQNSPTSGQPAIVRISGVSKLETGTGDLTADDLVQTDTDGTGITAATGDYVGAKCIKGAAAGELSTVVVLPSGGQIN